MNLEYIVKNFKVEQQHKEKETDTSKDLKFCIFLIEQIAKELNEKKITRKDFKIFL